MKYVAELEKDGDTVLHFSDFMVSSELYKPELSKLNGDNKIQDVSTTGFDGQNEGKWLE